MKKKVLFVVHQLNHGGVQKALLSALDAVDYDENEVTLYIRKNRTELIDSVNPGVSKILVNDDNTKYYRQPYIIFLQLIIFILGFFGLKTQKQKLTEKMNNVLAQRQMKYEKKHYFANDEKYNIAVAYIQGLTAKFVSDYVDAEKKIMFFHGSEDERHDLHKVIINKFDKIVGVNEGVKNVLCQWYPEHTDKMTFLENYVDAEEVIRKSAEADIEKEENKTIICSCSRIVPVKGFDMAVKAARILKEKEYHFKWIIVGDGPYRKELENLISENGVNDCFEITGMKDNPYPWIKECDIFVLSSYAEAQPLSIIEAQILHKPVVSTVTVGGKCLVRDKENGLLCNFSSESLAAAIEELMVNEELRKKIIDTLCEKDYSQAELKYRNEWKKLLVK